MSERRFSRRLRTCIVGLPACAKDEYEPFQVARLLLSYSGEDAVRTRALGRESGRDVSRISEKSGFMGDGGAYISESWDSSVGVVRAENSWRMWSHCVCVVCNEEWRATRRGEVGEVGFMGLAKTLKGISSSGRNAEENKHTFALPCRANRSRRAQRHPRHLPRL